MIQNLAICNPICQGKISQSRSMQPSREETTQIQNTFATFLFPAILCHLGPSDAQILPKGVTERLNNLSVFLMNHFWICERGIVWCLLEKHLAQSGSLQLASKCVLDRLAAQATSSHLQNTWKTKIQKGKVFASHSKQLKFFLGGDSQLHETLTWLFLQWTKSASGKDDWCDSRADVCLDVARRGRLLQILSFRAGIFPKLAGVR